LLCFVILCFHDSCPPLYLHSFPTRRSSDLVVFLAAIGAVNLAIFVSTFARSELQVLQFIPIIVVPQGLLSGIFWSVSSLSNPCGDRKSTRLNSSHLGISYAVFCFKKKRTPT